mmetsp:Transcript_55509/g.118055  ORF Transcript_55509/g.118055 Transcript_55509/m.118055 type:complete len:214 (-) Transcript_55509:1256-1897(-)
MVVYPLRHNIDPSSLFRDSVASASSCTARPSEGSFNSSLSDSSSSFECIVNILGLSILSIFDTGNNRVGSDDSASSLEASSFGDSAPCASPDSPITFEACFNPSLFIPVRPSLSLPTLRDPASNGRSKMSLVNSLAVFSSNKVPAINNAVAWRNSLGAFLSRSDSCMFLLCVTGAEAFLQGEGSLSLFSPSPTLLAASLSRKTSTLSNRDCNP